MGAAAYAVLFLSIFGCIIFGFIHWGKESTPLACSEQEKETDKAAV
ncbi:MAG: hypothetical protein PQJ46_15195 [Spirochaetales bacterium]|nr:hypothetical protein [Spirochaetales bacterium]